MSRLIHCALLAVACALSATAFAQKAGEKTWRKITQVEDRFVVFIDQPALKRQGDLVTFSLAYIYKPNDVFFGKTDDDPGKAAGWQEYKSMTVNCKTAQMRAGPRLIHGPDGAVLHEDNNQDFADIIPETAAEDAARARCSGDYWVGQHVISDGPGWMDAARTHLAETPAPERPMRP